MTETIIRLHEQRPDLQAMPAALDALPPQLQDARGRPLRDLRISVTDRCNFRCVYCMPRTVFDKDYPFLPHDQVLRFEEVARIAAIFVRLGVRKIRLTGGEPLLRKNLPHLIELLAQLRCPGGSAPDLTLTTNASLLAKKAPELKAAGLQRITVSLDALSDQTFRQMADADFSVSDVLRGLDAAHAAGLGPIKVNMVVKRGMNEHEILPMARYFKGSPFTLRFIEYMDVGASNGWRMEHVVSLEDILAILAQDETLALHALPAQYQGETAQRFAYRDGGGEVGVIASVTRAFCADCNRIRLSTEGMLYTCLFASGGHDLRRLLRSSTDDDLCARSIAALWRTRADRYSDIRSADTAGLRRKIEMSYIGG
ncbi:GTP 3',8-cyclase MoaA [Massilia sp. W12]|uniref:GTP 3',8-cyclase MoaA n=1 Tax=Massilia sp. W12 TaxID=3126507 RepID=UPI0030D1608A